MSWLPEQKGNGLDRYFYGFTETLARAGVAHCGLVAGTAAAERDSGGRIQAFAREDAPLLVRWMRLRSAFARCMQEQRPAVVASHFALYAHPVRRQLARLAHVVHFHGPWADESSFEGAGPLAARAKHSIESSVYRTGTRFIALSNAFARLLVERYGVDDEKVRVVPGGVDVDWFATVAGSAPADIGHRVDAPQTPAAPGSATSCGAADAGLLSRRAARERLHWPVDRPVVVAVRRLAHRMGLENLLAAVHELRHRHPELLVVIAGSGPLRAVLETQIEQLDLSRHVQLAGFVPEEMLPLAYRAADFSVVPTQALEGFGLIVLESLASGTPVLVTPVGGLPEVLAGFADRLVLESSSVGSLAAGMDAALRGTLPLPTGEQCQAYVRRQFSWPKITRDVLAVYSEALAVRGA